MRIVIVMNRIAGGFSPEQPDAWGGGEESLVSAARALVRAGHAVTVLYDGPALDDEGVRYLPRDAPTEAFDGAIFFKTPELGDALRDLAPRRILWTDQELAFDPEPFGLICPVSAFLARQLAARAPKCAPKLAVVPYALEAADFAGDGEAIPREGALVLHASSPDRGLETLLTEVWPRVVGECPEARLLVTYGWERFTACGGDPRLRRRIKRAAEAIPGNTVTLTRLSRMEMHRAFRRAGVWAYYCTGGEQFCVTALKAQAAGCVPVVRRWGALQETVRAGLHTDEPAAFAACLLEALDPARQETLRAAIDRSWLPTWDHVAEQLLAALETERPQDPTALAFVPATPEMLAPVPGQNARGMVQQAIAQWLEQTKPQAPAADPSLDVRLPEEVTEDTDALVIGFELEDAPIAPAAYLASRHLRPGLRLLLITSYGPWRAGRRRRHLDRFGLLELFGTDAQIRAIPLDDQGNGFAATALTYWPERIGRRDLGRVLRHAAPRETLSVCYIAPWRWERGDFLSSLRSIQPIADEIIYAGNGQKDDRPSTLVDMRATDLLADFERATKIPVRIVEAPSPRWCFDCRTTHAVGEMVWGHRLAGFETPRNVSIAAARGDWICWLDCDELVENVDNLPKYLRPNGFAGYGIPQHHGSVDPPQAAKTDFPIRLFRRVPDGRPAGWIEERPPGWQGLGGPGWPTYHPGLTVRFTGIVHEHPGHPPTYTEGLLPIVVLGDVQIGHTGYLTEAVRRGRFRRNWPLMAADRQKYPGRRLGEFLWLRDLDHHRRYVVEVNRGQPTEEARMYAEEEIRIFRAHFLTRWDAFSQEALDYVSGAYRMLGRGQEFEVVAKRRMPQVTGDHTVEVRVAGIDEGPEDAERMLASRRGELGMWQGPYL